MRNSGFKLYELMLVIGILLVLAALTFFILAPVREKARRTTCLQNLRQLAVAFTLYRQDWDGTDSAEGIPLTPAQLGLPTLETIVDVPDRCGCLPKSYIANCELWWCPSRYADPLYEDRPNLATSYRVSFFTPRFARSISRNPAYPILACSFHNPVAKGGVRNYLRVERVLGLSLDGSVRWWDRNMVNFIAFASDDEFSSQM